jgi:putative YphP/YqiW family bacilliredoxin
MTHVLRVRSLILPYPEQLIAIMRQDLTQFGVKETRTPEQVDAILGPDSGNVLMIVNSVCGCAAGKARPAIGLALEHSANKPDATATVFAGADVEAVARVREKLSAYPPSSPSMALFRNGTPVFMLHRSDIESRTAPQIAEILLEAFDQHCVPAASRQ